MNMSIETVLLLVGMAFLLLAAFVVISYISWAKKFEAKMELAKAHKVIQATEGPTATIDLTELSINKQNTVVTMFSNVALLFVLGFLLVEIITIFSHVSDLDSLYKLGPNFLLCLVYYYAFRIILAVKGIFSKGSQADFTVKCKNNTCFIDTSAYGKRKTGIFDFPFLWYAEKYYLHSGNEGANVTVRFSPQNINQFVVIGFSKK